MKSAVENQSIDLSPSLKSLSVENNVTSHQIAGQLFEMHPEYANGLARSVRLKPTSIAKSK